MNKREFVQRAAIRIFDPAAPDVDRAVAYAERLWDRLTERGYGARRDHEPRAHLNWYDALSPQQRDWFDRFWAAFAYKQGRNGAAMRWAQINPDARTADHIIAAAVAEAEHRKRLPEGQTPIMAQGWLNARRWEDYPAPDEAADADAAQARAAERQRLQAEVVHVERLADRTQNTETAHQLYEQAEALKRRVATLEHDG